MRIFYRMQSFESYIKLFKKGQIDDFDLDEILVEKFNINKDIVRDIITAHADSKERLNSFLNEFDNNERRKINRLINDLLKMEKELINLLKKIQSLNSIQNTDFVDKFKTLKRGSILPNLISHLEIIYEINKDSISILSSLKLIKEIFPKTEDINDDSLKLTNYRQYSIPYYFIKLIADNFHSKIPVRGKKRIVFGNIILPRKNIGIEVDYNNFIDYVLTIISKGHLTRIKATHITGRQS